MRYTDALFDFAMQPLELLALAGIRAENVGAAAGKVLEIGAGTGANIGFYRPDRLASLTLSDLEPDERLSARSVRFAGGCTVPVRLVAADAGDLPFPDASFDSVVSSLVLCSVPSQPKALAEIRRVLRPGGQVHFVEHVRPHGVMGHLFDGATAAWHALTGECHLNRDTVAAIEATGFVITRLSARGRGVLAHGHAIVPEVVMRPAGSGAAAQVS